MYNVRMAHIDIDSLNKIILRHTACSIQYLQTPNCFIRTIGISLFSVVSEI